MIQRALRSRGLAIVASVVLLSATAGCATDARPGTLIDASPTPSPSLSLSLEPPVGDIVLTEADRAACLTPDMAAAIAAALETTTISPENSPLVTLQELREMERPESEVLAQAEKWAALNPEQRAFQFCLNLNQATFGE